MPYAYTNHIQIYYQHMGFGHPVLFIPGAGYGGWLWRKVAEPLSDRYQTILPDLRGSGETDKPVGPYSVPMLSRDMWGLLDRLKIRGAFVVGHSLGTYVAQQMALDRPELVSKLVLAAGTYGGTNVEPISEEAFEALTERKGNPEELLRREIEVSTAEDFATTHPEQVQDIVDYRLSGAVPAEAYQAQQAANIAMALPDAGFQERLAQVTVPTLILFGEHDRVVPVANANLLAAHIPGAVIKILPGVGHLFPLEAPQATAEALAEFFGGRQYEVAH